MAVAAARDLWGIVERLCPAMAFGLETSSRRQRSFLFPSHPSATKLSILGDK